MNIQNLFTTFAEKFYLCHATTEVTKAGDKKGNRTKFHQNLYKMDYRKIGDTYYIRMDRGDEVIANILEVCRKESIPSAVFSGIGGCKSAELQVFIPETGEFETEQLEGMLELVSINGNVVSGEDGRLYHHTHALFSYKQDGQHGMAGGHLKATTVLYTAEIELRPTVGGSIGRKFDPETGTGFWEFK